MGEALLLSRLQFAFVIAFHFLLPAFTIGLASYIAVLEGLYLCTGRPVYLRLSAFWIAIFAVSFGMGVVSGIVMPFQFGTNWSRYSELTADVVGAADGLRGPDGVLPRGGVPRRAAVRAQARAAVGALRRRGDGRASARCCRRSGSSSANSWMQTPAGIRVVDGRFVPDDWMQIIFNPSFPVPLHAHRDGVLSHHRVHGDRRRRVLPAARPPRRGEPRHDHDGRRPRWRSSCRCRSLSATCTA